MSDLDLTRYEGHTEGPWGQKEQTMFNHPIYICGDTRVVADVVAGSGLDELPPGDYETRANARLIADAPLLLAEVRRLDLEHKAAERELLWVRQSHARLLAAAKQVDNWIVPRCICSPGAKCLGCELRAAVAEAEALNV